MIKIIKYIKGYVFIRVWGYSPERFMNLCSNHNILLWNIENHGAFYTMCVSVDGFFRIKACLKKTRTKVAIEKRCGLPFLVPKMKKRKFFGAGLIFCFLFLFTMSRFLWAIDFEGNRRITDDMLKDFLTEKGVCYGVKKGDIDIEVLETSLRETFHEITWTSARLDGTKLTIRIKENETLHIENQNGEENTLSGMDLVADNSGVIVSMITRTGVPNVSVGDTINPGDILVAGKVPIFNEDATIKKFELCKADADIFIQCTYPIKEVLPFDYKAKAYTGNQKKDFFIKIMEKEYNLPGKVPYLKSDCVIEEKQFHLLENFYLPFSAGYYEHREYYVVEKKYTKEQAATILKNKLIKIAKTLEEKGVQIIEKNVKIETGYEDNKQKYILNGNFHIIEPAGILKETEMEIETEAETNE